MNKRQFLAAGAALGSIVSPQAGEARPRARAGPGLLTVAGAIARGNRGALDPALDQLMVKHGTAAFDRAWEFDAAMLARLPAVTIRPTLEYDAKVHAVSGPLLGTVIDAAGVAPGAPLVRLRHRPLGRVQGQAAEGALRVVSVGLVFHRREGGVVNECGARPR